MGLPGSASACELTVLSAIADPERRGNQTRGTHERQWERGRPGPTTESGILALTLSMASPPRPSDFQSVKQSNVCKPEHTSKTRLVSRLHCPAPSLWGFCCAESLGSRRQKAKAWGWGFISLPTPSLPFACHGLLQDLLAEGQTSRICQKALGISS